MFNSFKIKDNFELKLAETSVITLFIEGSKININYELENGDYKILVFNNSKSDVELKETGYIKNGNVLITYIELNEYRFSQIQNFNVYKDSSLDINSIYLGINKKNIVLNTFNNEYNSNVHINNNVVCLDDADFNLEVIGNIKAGAKNSKCLQKSQCLTFSAPKKARVLPVLNIDENDVEASHSLSSGTIDEEVLFYMNSRGLNKKEALGLLLVSYLMPNDKFYEEYKDGSVISELSSKKVNQTCMM